MINDKTFLFNSTQTLSINAGISKGDENLRSNLIGRDEFKTESKYEIRYGSIFISKLYKL